MTIPNNETQAATTDVTTWTIDPAASRVEFRVRMRLLFLANVTVRGRFTDVRGTVTGKESDPTSVQVSVTIGVVSLNTKSRARDTHLRSPDFFEVEHYPNLTFTSRRIEALDPAHGHYRVTGELAIRDVAREVSLDAWQVTQPTAAGQPRYTLNLTAVLDRRDFGLVWSRPIQQIADEVNITLHIELVPASLTTGVTSK
jgi:polyisoprenoid-binding protein YceI